MFQYLNQRQIRQAQNTVYLMMIVLIGTWGSVIPELSAFSKKTNVKVMSRNLYVGADIFKIVQAANFPEQGELSIPLAVAEVFDSIQYTNFKERAEAIADEIQTYHPHVIGLQEVSTIFQQVPGDFLAGNPEAATDVLYDYQKILIAALKARKLNYEVAATVTNADVELPMLAGKTDDGMPLFHDIRLVDRDMILVRSDIVFENPHAQNFTTNVSLSLAGTQVEFTRGYTKIDARVKDLSFCFVNTHLEVSGGEDDAFSAVQAAQMNELLMQLNHLNKTTILLGDFNSSPEEAPIDSTIYGQIIPPYIQILASGYVDLAIRPKKAPEPTCCFNETIDDPQAALYERIDHIFVLPQNPNIAKTKLTVFGDRRCNMTPSGFWPSDHAGVFSSITF